MTDAPPVWRKFHDNTPVEIRGYVRPAVADVYGFVAVTTRNEGEGWQRDVQDCFKWLRGRRLRSGDVYLLGPLTEGDAHVIRWAFAPHLEELAGCFSARFGADGALTQLRASGGLKP